MNRSILLAVLAAALLAGPALAEQISFDPAVNYAAGTRPDGAILADLDGDLDLDLAVTSDLPDKVSIFPNLGNGTFGPRMDIPVANSSSPHSLAAADFDGDQDMDLAVSLNDFHQVQLIMNNGGVWTPGATFATGLSPRDLATADLNGDKAPDLVASNRDGNTVSVFLNNGAGGFHAATNLAAGTEPRGVTLNDFNGDKAPDMAVSAHDSREVLVYLNNGAGGFGAPASLFTPNVRPGGITSADLDGDGDNDIAAATSTTGQNFASVFTNNGGAFTGPVNYPVGGINPGGIAAADFDLDGDQDLATSNEDSANVSALENLGGSFGNVANFGVGTTPERIAAGDLDGNGSPDLVTSNRDSNNVSVLINQKGGGACQLAYTSGSPCGVNQSSFTISPHTGQWAIYWSLSTGSTSVSIGSCAGVTLDLGPLGPPKFGGPPVTLNGPTVSKRVPPAVCGTVMAQGVDLQSCCVTNVVTAN